MVVALAFAVPIGVLESVAGVLPFVLFGLVLLNILTRFLAHRAHVQQATAGSDDEELSRYLPHEATTVSLLVGSFLFTIVEPNGGVVLSVLVLAMFLSDFFEYESRKVEARNNMTVERPKSALAASLLVFLYAGFESVFFLVAPLWNSIV